APGGALGWPCGGGGGRGVWFPSRVAGSPPGAPTPPLTYLTRWRMTLAADLLTERETATVAEIARTVGYTDAFAFSAAFKRIRGVSPSEFRRAGAAR
ncbi:helix-turn-helix transcriptional regulator, partial [Streptomyces sp. NPDC059569]|uniref:helix-turn-helix transcriptional regulator n=1 Tax=Streptomyces sp. NPDC059569 TaxID=3346869 RepID=UPI003697E510